MCAIGAECRKSFRFSGLLNGVNVRLAVGMFSAGVNVGVLAAGMVG